MDGIAGKSFLFKLVAFVLLVSQFSFLSSVSASSVAEIPAQLSPADGYISNGETFELRWEELASAVNYRYEACKVDPGDIGGVCTNVLYSNDTYIGTIKKASYSEVFPKPINRHFWWRVSSKNEDGVWSNYGPARELTLDNSLPIITLNGSTDMTLSVDSTYTEPGATAYDTFYSGDLTGAVVKTGVVDTSTIGDYVVSYNVTDEAGNAAVEVQRAVHVIAKPQIPAQLSPADGYISNGETFELRWEELASAVNYRYEACKADPGDAGELCTNVLYSNDTYTGTIKKGSYVEVFPKPINRHFWWRVSSKNAAGDWSNYGPAREITLDNSLPIITLNGSADVAVNTGSSYIEFGATASDEFYSGDLTSAINVSGTVNTSVVGDYVLSYNVTDEAGNAAIEVQRTVHVVAAPVEPPADVVDPPFIPQGPSGGTPFIPQALAFTPSNQTGGDAGGEVLGATTEDNPGEVLGDTTDNKDTANQGNGEENATQTNVLGLKVLGLPAWAWILIVLGIIGGILFITSRRRNAE